MQNVAIRVFSLDHDAMAVIARDLRLLDQDDGTVLDQHGAGHRAVVVRGAGLLPDTKVTHSADCLARGLDGRSVDTHNDHRAGRAVTQYLDVAFERELLSVVTRLDEYHIVWLGACQRRSDGGEAAWDATAGVDGVGAGVRA
eukprot:scaffold142396_cov133-Phaeocystis_antarctica.AAC.4